MDLKIRQERQKRCWTLEYVASQIGITKSAYRLVEIAERKPSYEVLVKLENLFGLSHRELFAAVSTEIVTDKTTGG